MECHKNKDLKATKTEVGIYEVGNDIHQYTTLSRAFICHLPCTLCWIRFVVYASIWCRVRYHRLNS